MIDGIVDYKAWQENLPHTITPLPPAWTVYNRQAIYGI